VLLNVEGLEVEYPTDREVVHAVRGVSLSLAQGEILGIVGESGSGKSATVSAIARLLPPPGRIVGGKVEVNGVDLRGRSERQLRRIRGSVVGLVAQDSAGAMNPVMRVGEHVAEVLRMHQRLSRTEAWSVAVGLLAETGIHNADRRARDYPHQFSGGMQQRAMIAASMACEPQLLLADEPTTALDPTTEREILLLLRRMCLEKGSGLIIVTHDLRIAAAMCDRVAVMKSGVVVEEGRAKTILNTPGHPYTQTLVRAVAMDLDPSPVRGDDAR
jgi:ABC-type dipeptide/oligopeptide/nickel transport system ATPase component